MSRFNGTKGANLMVLERTFNGDSRFRMDERFIDEIKVVIGSAAYVIKELLFSFTSPQKLSQTERSWLPFYCWHQSAEILLKRRTMLCE